MAETSERRAVDERDERRADERRYLVAVRLLGAEHERASQAETTALRTRTGERIYDLIPLASELWAIAGPDGLDPTTVDSDDLPVGYRWLEDDEWELAQDRGDRHDAKR